MKLLSLLLSALLLISSGAKAYCFSEAGQAMKVDPLLLLAFAIQESRLKSNAVGVNKPDANGNVSYDYGLMQINSLNVDKVFRHFGIDKNVLLTNPCINVYAGAYILRKNFDQYGVNWFSIGAYNAGVKNTPEQERKRRHYAQQVRAIYLKLQEMDRAKKIDL
jgi:soluble lytic murein transglycosylase-like protein